jgi:hypothetical protein
MNSSLLRTMFSRKRSLLRSALAASLAHSDPSLPADYSPVAVSAFDSKGYPILFIFYLYLYLLIIFIYLFFIYFLFIYYLFLIWSRYAIPQLKLRRFDREELEHPLIPFSSEEKYIFGLDIEYLLTTSFSPLPPSFPLFFSFISQGMACALSCPR